MEIGRVLGSWHLLAPLGAGGSGTVFLAREASGREGALKISHGDGASLRREVRLLAEIKRPDIAEVLDHGVEEGRVWLVTRRVQGDTLAAAGLSQRPMEVAAACELVERICAPLAWLHGEGLVHGDLKPSNVVVAGQEIVLIDFGLAARTGLRASVEDAPRGGGSAAWMAPERVRGEAWDARADLYSLGCILYELVTGLSPFANESLEATLAAHLEHSPPRPSALVPGVPAGLDRLLARLLSRSPSDRLDAVRVAAALAELRGAPPRPMLPPPRPWLPNPAFRGRGRELREIERLLAMGPVSVEGVAGSGKSRLLLEAGAQARRAGWRVLYAAGRPQEEAPLASLRHALADQEIKEPDTIAVLALLWPEWAARTEAPAVLAGQSGARARFVEALSAALAELAGPLLLVIDDLHLADEATRAWARSELPEGVHLLVSGGRLGQELVLDRLGEGAAQDIVEELIGGVEVDKRERVCALAGGNPWLLCELTRQVSVGREPARSAALRSIVNDALRGLRGAPARIATVLAVLGPVPEPEWLARLAGLRERSLDLGVQELLRRGVLESESLRFRNELLRSTVARRTPPARVRDLHRALAELIIQRYGEAAGPHSSRLAPLLAGCGESREAAHHYRAAAVEQKRVGNSEAALAHLDAAIALLEARESIPVRVARAFEVLAVQGELDQAERLMQQCLEEARQFADDGLIALSGLRLASLVWRRGQPARARLLLDEALVAAQRAEVYLDVGMIHGELASIANEEGDRAEELAQNEAALAAFERVAREANPRLTDQRPLAAPPARLAEANGAIYGANLGLTLLTLGRDEEAVALLERCVQTLEAMPEFRLKALTPRGILAMAHLEAGRLDAAEPLFRRVLADARALGDRLNECITHQMLARLALARGQDPSTEVDLGLALAMRYGFAHPLAALRRLRHPSGRSG